MTEPLKDLSITGQKLSRILAHCTTHRTETEWVTQERNRKVVLERKCRFHRMEVGIGQKLKGMYASL